MPPARSTCALLLLFYAFAIACDGRPSEARRLREDIEPFLDEHARYDRWARRMGIAESAFRSPEALAEAAFAPLRDRRRVVAAWLVREGTGATELRYPPDVPGLPADGWIRIVLPEHELEEVHAQRTSLQVAGEQRDVVLIRRSRPAHGGGTLHVTLAF